VTARRTSLGSGGGAGGGGSGQHGKKSRNKDINSKAKPAHSQPLGKKAVKPSSTPKAAATGKSTPSLAATFHTDSSMSSSEEEAALKKLSPRKEFSKGGSGRNSEVTSLGNSASATAASSSKLANIYSDSDSENDVAAAASSAVNVSGGSSRGRRLGKKAGKLERKKTESSSAEGRRDSEDTLDRAPRSPVFRTKAAMKEFSLEDLHRAKELAKNSGTSKSTPMSPSNEVAVTKPGSLKLDGKQSRRQRLASPSEAMETELGAGVEEEELLGGPPIILVPERSAARKANQRLKFPATDDKNKKVAEPALPMDTGAIVADGSRKKVGGPAYNNKTTAAAASLFGDSDSDDTVAVVAASTRGRSRSPVKSAITAGPVRDVRKSPRGSQHGATVVSLPSDSELSDLEPSVAAAAKKSSPAVSVVKQPQLASRKSAKTIYDKAAAAGGPSLSRSSLAFSDDEDGEISFLPSKDKTTKVSASAARLHNRGQKAQKSPLTGEVEFDSLLPPAEVKARSDSESDAEFR
jgi:hypothetical protein